MAIPAHRPSLLLSHPQLAATSSGRPAALPKLPGRPDLAKKSASSGGFFLKNLFRDICSTNTYQRMFYEEYLLQNEPDTR